MDPQTVAIGLGLVVSLLFTEAFGFAAGGMIVPGYLALQFHRPLDVGLTLLTSAAALLVVVGVSQVANIRGRCRASLLMLLGAALAYSGRQLLLCDDCLSATPRTAQATVIDAIGYLVPGLIALWFDRQGLIETVGTVLAT
jgi:poly-gamma-glutamate biosynthesis protein PgsC/CapC